MFNALQAFGKISCLQSEMHPRESSRYGNPCADLILDSRGLPIRRHEDIIGANGHCVWRLSVSSQCFGAEDAPETGLSSGFRRTRSRRTCSQLLRRYVSPMAAPAQLGERSKDEQGAASHSFADSRHPRFAANLFGPANWFPVRNARSPRLGGGWRINLLLRTPSRTRAWSKWFSFAPRTN
jgi:hypothetical protein